MSDYPKVFVKGDLVEVANTAAQAVSMRYRGLREQDASLESADYAELKRQAKALGIPANQSKAALGEAIAASSSPALDDSAQPDTDA